MVLIHYTTSTMKLTVLHASPNVPSNSVYLGKAFMKAFTECAQQIEIEEIRLYDAPLERFTLDHYDPTHVPEEEYETLRQAVNSADALLITSPVWNFGVPGVLKNTIDRMGVFTLQLQTEADKVNGKPVFILLTGGAPKPAWIALTRKTTSFVAEGLAYMGFSAVGTHYEPRCTPGFKQYGLVVDTRPECIEVITKKAQRFYRIVEQFTQTGKAPLYYRIRRKCMKFGEKILKKFF